MSDSASGPAPPSRQIVPGVVIIRFEDGATLDDALPTVGRAFPNLVLDRVIAPRLNTVMFRITDAAAVLDVIDRLSQRAGELRILWVEPSYVARFSAKPNDPLYPLQGTLPQIGAPLLWAQPANKVRIAIIDSGIPCDANKVLTHPDLQNNIVFEQNYVPGETFDDRVGHGTMVAGICGADSNNGIGMTGVAWNVPKHIYKVPMSTGVLAQAIHQAVADTPTDERLVINFSVGGPPNQVLEDACDVVRAGGAILCACTGNDGKSTYVDYPAAYAATNIAVISVGAVDCNNQRSAFSNYKAGCVTLVAPGVGILSCVIAAQATYGDYSYSDGTSCSTPFAAGIVAQVWAARGGSRDDLVMWIEAHCIPLSDQIPSAETGYGLITGVADENTTAFTLNFAGDIVV